ncbi:thiamine pyrophosphate-dependent enzyme [Xylophilus sp. ASV27]|uniref:thiamine pyrophosphate-dependent enzyme n=1 Tax=Xylophilus sp. ASV27 TaxID=2795129 RepID=UPI00351C6BC7
MQRRPGPRHAGGRGRGADAAAQDCDLPDIDFCALARGQGCDAVRVDDAHALHGVLRDALAATRPTLVEVEVA